LNLDLSEFDSLYLSARRNDATDKLEAAWIDRTVAHGDQKDMKKLKGVLEEIIGTRTGVKGLNEFMAFAGKGL
jgi:hypothetical protein